MASQPEWLKITQGNQLRRVIRPADYLPARGDDVTMFVLRLEQNTTAMRKSLEEIEGKDIRDAIPETDDPHDIKIVGGKPPHHRGQVTGEVMGKNLLECL